jgi:hypothetical protein
MYLSKISYNLLSVIIYFIFINTHKIKNPSFMGRGLDI